MSTYEKLDVTKLVSLTEKTGTFGRPELFTVCRGHDDIAVVLNYFLYEACKEITYKKLNTETIEYAPIKRTLDDIMAGIHKTVSKKTLISYIKKLQEWEFIHAHSYRQQYDVYFKRVDVAVKNPPQADEKKPRGKRPAKQDCKITISTILPENGQFTAEDIVNLNNQIVILQSQMVDLQFEVVKLQSQIVNLQSPNSDEVNVQARSVAQKHTPKNTKNTKKKKEETQKTAHAVGDVSFSHLQDTLFGDTSPSKQEKAAMPTASPSVKPMKTKTQKTETPRYISRPSTKTEPVVASEQEQRIVEVWSSIFKRPLPLNDAIILAARRLARCEPTVDDLRECRAFCYKSNPDWFGLQGRTRGRVTLKDVADYWEGWQSSLDALPTSTQSEKPATKIQQQLQEKAPDFVFLTTDKLMELPLAERKAYNAAMRAAIRANEEKQAVNA